MRYELTKYLNRHNIEGFSLSQLKYIRNGLDQDWNYSNDILGDIRLYKRNGGSIKHLECICKYYSRIDGFKVQQKKINMLHAEMQELFCYAKTLMKIRQDVLIVTYKLYKDIKMAN